jgi:hypothetical protein
MKKALSILLAVLMFTSLFTVSAFADEFSGEGAFEEAQALLKRGEVPTKWEFVQWLKEPTCTENGVGLYRKAADKDPEPEPIAADGHNWGLETVVPDGGADCISGGYFHKEKVCKDCGAVEITEESKYYPPENHDFTKSYTFKTLKEATCGTTGLKHHCCAICGALDPSTTDEVIPATGEHEFGAWNYILAPTCTDVGYGTHYCNVCRLQEDAVIPALGHDYEVVPGTEVRENCLEFSATFKCTRCDDEFDATNELYTDWAMNEQHLFGDWEVTTEALCETVGNEARTCSECGFVENHELPAIGHKMGTELRTFNLGDTDGDGLDNFAHYYFCVNDADPKPGKDHVSICGLAVDPTIAPNADGVLEINPENARFKLFDGHEWGEWTCLVEPIEGVTYGHWVRVCMIPVVKDSGDDPCAEREEFIGSQAEFDAYNKDGDVPPTPVPPVEDEPVNGLVWEIDETGKPVCKLYKDGEVDEAFTGIYDYDGGKFFVANGIMCSDANGAAEFGGTFYFLAEGQIQTQYTGLALYDGEWFYVKNGVIDLETNGLVEHDGGLFLVGAGRIQREVNGLVVLEDGAYYVANGQVVTNYTGLVQYDGAFFYVENGKLNLGYNGTVEYDGEQFDVNNGMAVV